MSKIRAKETSEVQLWLFSRLPKLARKSTTLDNGSEHYLHTRLQEELGMRTYFADSYCSWQWGTNESTNGLLRRYFPIRHTVQLCIKLVAEDTSSVAGIFSRRW